ncbi:NADPH dehydrogenase [Alphaproteobacteria bacterium SO-S41]|nr:NADPH dehydrogenase [Alphaproteobacteria bacterium SO-S41]
MTDLFAPLTFLRGPALKNRFVLAPLTNTQSHEDGTLSDDEFRWLTYRAEGGFGLTMTCAAHVQKVGQGFPGQLGIFSDDHLPGLMRLAAEIKKFDSVSVVQIHHAGMRSPADLIGEAPVSPSADEATGARALSLAEVGQLREDFIAAAVRAEKAGFDGVEIHGAHGYILCAFLSPEINQRTDQYGGSPENRARLIFEIVDGIRARTKPGFNLGIRLSPERFGLKLAEIVAVARKLLAEAKIDYLDMSLWDVFKEPEEAEFKGRTLASYFTELPRGEVRLGAAGKITSGATVKAAMALGLDFVVIGRGAVLHHDFPELFKANDNFTPIPLPVSEAHLRDERLSSKLVTYMRNWKGFVAD